jgi:hypothetical protein
MLLAVKAMEKQKKKIAIVLSFYELFIDDDDKMTNL